MTKSETSSHLMNFLCMAEVRPGMYFGSICVSDVHKQLAGWQGHRHVAKDDDTFADHFFSNFHDYVGKKYNDRSTYGWPGVIRKNTSSEIDEYPLFMELLREFFAEFSRRNV